MSDFWPCSGERIELVNGVPTPETARKLRGEGEIDPTCAFHGIKWSEHEGGRCLHCPICFRSDFGYPKWVDADGQMWDLCQECGEREGEA